jgi:DNA polymerase-3 subunit alpha
MDDFVHLHLHTQYSLLDGAIRVADLADRAAKFGMRAVAMTDHGNMFGAVDFYKKMKKAGVKPILGCETYVAETDRNDRTKRRSHHLILLAQNDTGYRNLTYLVSKGYLEGFYYNPRIDKGLLRERSEGLIALSACLAGEPSQKLLQEGYDASKRAALEYREIFGDRYFLEVQSNGLADQERCNQAFFQIARETGIPLAATNDCHYLTQKDAKAHEVLMCIQMGKTMQDESRLQHEMDSLWFKPAGDMWGAFGQLEEAAQNTLRIADMCDVSLDLGKTFLPKFKVPDDRSPEQYLCDLARAGLGRRLEQEVGAASARGGPARDVARYQERLEYELDVIRRMGFGGYFLIVWDFIRFAKQNDIPVGPGRGSGAGSLVAYALEITDIDPLQYGLLFERFLNPERVSMPDFDVDFCMERRDEVIRYVGEKYGVDRVGQIITHHSLKTRGVIRDVGRVMGMSYGDVDKIAKLVPEGPKVDLRGALEAEPRLKEQYETDPKVRELYDFALSLEGLHRHAGMHAAGIVIADKPLWEVVPLFRGPEGELVTQFSKDEVEEVGLVKFDFLGLKTLTVIDRAVKLIRKVDPGFDIRRIPMDDRATFELIGAGDTTGVFQLESSGFKELLKRLRADRFEDIVAAVALYRPGPLESGMVDDYIDRKHGRKKVAYPHALTREILAETYGVMVYQEQVMLISVSLCGFTMGQADMLRKAMGKKMPEVIAKQREAFVNGALAHGGMAGKDAEHLFDQIEKFAGYAFNKSHSAAYGLITYQTGWLKAHYPVEFMAALLSCDRDDTDKIVRFIAEARAMGIAVERPDVNTSEIDFSVVSGKILFGLGGVKGVGETALESILAARTEKPFVDLFDFCERVDSRKVNKKVVEALIKSGAFDWMKMTRARVAGAAERAIERGSTAQKDRESGQGSLLDLFGGAAAKKEALKDALDEKLYPGAEAWAPKVELGFEREALGFYITGHPLDRYLDEIRRHATCATDGLGALAAGHGGEVEVAVGGVVSAYRETLSKRGGRMAFFQLEDQAGQVEVLVWPRAFETAEVVLKADAPILVRGKCKLEGEGDAAKPKVFLDQAVSLDELRSTQTSRVNIHLSAGDIGREHLEKLRKLFEAHPGTCQAVLHLRVPDARGVVQVSLPDKWTVAPTEALLLGIERLFGSKVAVLS